MTREAMKSNEKFWRSAAARVGARAVYFSGLVNFPKAYACFARARSNPHRVVWPFAVLLYHRVNPFRDPYFPALPAAAFDAQISYLASHFKIVSLSELLDGLDQGRGVEPRTVAITFDDGYRDNYLFAHPILAKRGIPASIFVATGYTETSRRMWNDRVAGAIKGTDRRAIHLHLAGEELSLPLDSDRRKIASLLVLLEKLKSLPDTEKNSIVDHLVEQLRGEDAPSDRLMLNWSELRAMASGGWEVGSHTVEHRILTQISDAEMQWELASSKKTLEENLQRSVALFAYPNGKERDFQEDTKRWVHSAGYRAALTTVGGLNGRGFEPFEIRRISPWDEPLPDFAVRLEWMFLNSVREIRRSPAN